MQASGSAARADVRTTRLQAAECSVPLPKPIRLGPVEIFNRDFVVLRLHAKDGLYGDAIGYPRGTPLLESVSRLSRRFLDVDPFLRRQAVDRVLGSLVNGRPSYIRATSLFEIALTDIACKVMGAPWYKLMGGVRNTAPVMVVAGYYLDSRTIDDVVREVSGLLEAGFPRIKINLLGTDPVFDARYVEQVNRVAEGHLAADAHWSWNSVAAAISGFRRLDEAGLAFLEDPFGPYRNDWVADLAAQIKTPIACGEDMPDTGSLLRLTDHARYLRVDATTCGGIGAAFGVSEAASLKGATILPHVFLPLHAQLAGCCPGVEMAELVAQSSGADPLDLLLLRMPPIENGFVHIDQTPGLGIELNWSNVEKYCVNSVAIDLEG